VGWAEAEGTGEAAATVEAVREAAALQNHPASVSAIGGVGAVQHVPVKKCRI
jgi:hypothetical protein